ncbi:MAG TPA: carboxypeptidase-like regulatory domain-containing protein [Variovorax sp.]|nr:carboxypeptidase-like regulatory domain-containing protein [Variovorax sp.]
MQAVWARRSVAVMAVAMLAACGGGGGGGGGGVGFAGLPAASSTVTLSGTATYVSIPNPNGALAYGQATPKPIRGASVEIVSGASAAVIATATTDANGAYSVSLPASTQVLVRIKAQMTQGGSGATWDVTVRDNTQSDAIFALETPSFSTGIAAITRDVQAPSGWDGSRYASTRVAAPFAVLDTVYAAQAKMLSVAPATAFPALKLFWSANNVPAVGNPALGQIGTTSFTMSNGARAIYVLGKENVDTDEYDASVIAHEWGHYYQSAFSRDDSPGGSHALTDKLDRRAAFSEGWGNAWSGIALARNNYTDAVGQGQGQGANIDLTASGVAGPGWFREASVHSILWRLNSQVGFKPINDTLTSAAFKNGVAVTSIHPFTAAFGVAAPGSVSVLAGLLSGEQISAAANDPFGVNETNDGAVAGVLPMYRPATVGGSTTACVTNAAGAGNKLGNYVYLRFSLPSAGTHTITVSGPSAADPDFAVYAGRQVDESLGFGATETKAVSLPAGDNVLVINDYNNSSANTCFNVSIQ